MKTKTQLAIAWSLVVILAILLAIAGFFLTHTSPKDQNLSEKPDLIRKHCSQTDQASRDACAQDLQDLSDILREFSTKKIPTASVKINP